MVHLWECLTFNAGRYKVKLRELVGTVDLSRHAVGRDERFPDGAQERTFRNREGCSFHGHQLDRVRGTISL